MLLQVLHRTNIVDLVIVGQQAEALPPGLPEHISSTFLLLLLSVYMAPVFPFSVTSNISFYLWTSKKVQFRKRPEGDNLGKKSKILNNQERRN